MPADLIAGRYRVQREIGRGGMGSVWLCRDERLGRDVAVKQVGGLPGESSMHLARALREARHSAALNHPNVVAIFDAVEEADHVWLVMEYVPSRTLDQIVREDGPLTPPEAARVAADVADGLATAHALGTVHRDVKPSNVLVRDDDGRALIADFGIARTVGQEQLTRSGLVTGTPMYFAPELARGHEPSPASDVWALGVTVYLAVEGRPPYDEQVNAIALLNTIAAQPPPVATHAGDLAPVLERMLDPDPASRCSMAEAAAALHDVARSTPQAEPEEAATAAVLAAPPSPPPPDTVPTRTGPRPELPRRRRGGAVLAVVVLVALLALVAGAGWWLTRDTGEDVAGPDRRASPSPTRSPSSSPPAPSSQAPPSSPSASTEEPEPEPTTEPTEQPDPGGDPEAFVADYYELLPEDTETSWQMLAPALQNEVGRGTFVGFWATIDDVTVDDVTADGTTVTVTLTYTTDGRTEQETRELAVEEQGGGLLITEDRGAV